jgi:hypothetical protein
LTVPVPPSSAAEPTDPATFTGLSEILRSWLWRTYDHLGRLLLCNLVWFFGVWGILGMVTKTPPAFWILLYLTACAYSVPWAYLTFAWTAGDGASWRDIGRVFRRYVLRALMLCLVFAVLMGIGVLNISFYLKWEGGMRYLAWTLTGIVAWLMVFTAGAAFYQWPILFFQDPPFLKVFYRSFLLFLGNSWTVLFLLLIAGVAATGFTLTMVPWALIGVVLLFSIQCVTLEKHLLRYKITYRDAPLEEVLERLGKERRRTWREFFKPWEAK